MLRRIESGRGGSWLLVATSKELEHAGVGDSAMTTKRADDIDCPDSDDVPCLGIHTIRHLCWLGPFFPFALQ